jgi:hypothetical protein
MKGFASAAKYVQLWGCEGGLRYARATERRCKQADKKSHWSAVAHCIKVICHAVLYQSDRRVTW